MNRRLGWAAAAAEEKSEESGGPGVSSGCPPAAPWYRLCGYKYGNRCGEGWIGGPTEMFGEG